MTDRDDRKSFRCAVPNTYQQCELKTETDMLSARLLDESAGGFAVLVDHLADIEVGQKSCLHTNAGWFVVHVVHIAEVVPPEDDESPADSETPWFRVGLLRMGEVAASDEPMASPWTDSLRCNLGQWCPGSGMLIILGVLLAIIVVVLPAGWIVGHFGAGQPGLPDRITGSATNKSRQDKPLPNLVPPRADESPFSSGKSDSSAGRSTFDSGSTFGADHGRALKSSPSVSLGTKWRKTVRRLPGASAFAAPEVVQELQLTADQQEQIRQLIEATSQAVRDLGKQAGEQQRQKISERRKQLFDQARRDAIDILTTEQRAQWEKLSGGQ